MTSRFAAAVQDVRPVPAEVPPPGVAEPARGLASTIVAERSPEPKSDRSASDQLAAAGGVARAPALPDVPAQSVVSNAHADVPAAAVPDSPVREARTGSDSNRERRSSRRTTARPDWPVVSERPIDTRRARGPVRVARQADDMNEPPRSRSLQLLRLRVYDFPDGSRIAVNPRTGETYTSGRSRRYPPPPHSVMGWLAGAD